MTNRNAAVEIAGLTKSYGGHTVLNGVDLVVPEGSVYALLGPNGAGKTTIVKILSTLLRPEAGELRVAGHDVRTEPDAVRASIGVTGQFSAVDELLTGRENLLLMADLDHLSKRDGRARADELLQRFDLVEAADRRADTYSGGMKRRLDLAMTLVNAPKLIFLDEPTTGLDPRSRRGLWQIARELVADGVTIFLTTQYMDEADELADMVGLLDGGRLVAEGTPNQLKRQIPGGRVEVTYAASGDLAAAARRFPHGETNDAVLTLTLAHDGGLAGLRQLIDQLDENGVVDVQVQTPDLDDVFLALTGRRAGSAEIDGDWAGQDVPTPETEGALA